MGDAVGVTAGRIILIQQTKRADDFGIGVGEDRIPYSSPFGEAR
jgi:hypothetical protein